MNDLIRRSDAIKAFEDVLDCDYPFISEETPRERIEAIPTAEPKRGKWLWDNGYFCSECHGEAFSQKFTMLIDDPLYFRSDFCPNCGADLRGRHNE